MAVFLQSEIRRKLLEAFSEAQGGYVSGQKISDLLGCSRTAVWKHIEELRKEGYELEAIRKKGYKIIGKPNKITSNEIRLGLETKTLGQEIYYYDSVLSTQSIAQELASKGVPEGTIVVADEQTGGRGRMARAWYSPKETGVWMSLILRPKIPIQQTPQLTLIAAVAIVQAIEEVTGLTPHIKWPNDILINNKKAVGILTELQAEADQVHSVIIGMGINVNQKQEYFPEHLQSIATSLAIEKGQPITRAELIQKVLLQFEKYYEQYLNHGFKPIKLLWESYAISLNKMITARTLSGTIKGKAIGINDEGVLLIETEEGRIEHIYSADIEINN